MTIICNTYHSTRDFNYHKDTKCFVVEASDFGKKQCESRVYDDACDTGFILVSQKTGNLILFIQDGVDMNGDEVAGWRYKGAYKTNGNKPGQWKRIAEPEFTALVIND